MNIHSHARRESRYHGVPGHVFQGKRRHSSVLQLEDKRPNAIAQRNIQGNINNSNRVQQMKTIAAGINASRRVKQLKTIDKNVNHYVTKQSTSGVAQFLKSHATKYIQDYNAAADKMNALEKNVKKHILKMTSEPTGVTRKQVKTIIADPLYSVYARSELLKQWNRGRQRYPISTPKELIPARTSVENTESFENWNSDDEEKMDLEKMEKSDITVTRLDKKKNKTIPKYPFHKAIRKGRQIVKRNMKFKKHFPIATEIGGHHIEFDSPYGTDIYAYPLVPDSNEKNCTSFHRVGGTGEHSWKAIAMDLEKETTAECGNEVAKIPEAKRRKIHNVFDCFTAGKKEGITSGVALAGGAIGCDLMKGSSGWVFIDKANKAVDTCAKPDLMKSFFYDDHPLYEPAASKGRGLVSELTRNRKLSAAFKASIPDETPGSNTTTTTTTTTTPPDIPVVSNLISNTNPSDTSNKPVSTPMDISATTDTSSNSDIKPKKEEEPKKT